MKRVHKHTALCREVAKHIQTQLDAGLRSADCRKIRKHLRRCPNCTAYLDSLKKTVLLYKRYPDPRVPSRTREKLWAILELPEASRRTK
jgi:predicted anti-sigma-YlaC factor YlaD